MDTDRTQAFNEILSWIQRERAYQIIKWGYGDEPPERLERGLNDGGWFWQTGVLNYTGRVRLFTLTNPLGRQALMKLITTLIHLAELAIVKYGPLPTPGVTSGELHAPTEP